MLTSTTQQQLLRPKSEGKQKNKLKCSRIKTTLFAKLQQQANNKN
jgi:hypothetical protein